MYSYFTFLELVKVISVHHAHRLLPEAALILCTWRNRLSVTVSGFDWLLSGNVAAFIGSQIRPLLADSGIRAARNGQSFAKYAPSAFTDEVNCINEKQKALRVVGVRSARACVTMPSAANQ
jgi:hypothetical protein